MPFPFDLSQVFWGLMNKTMWDCRLGNLNGFGGFNGGFMNSCWGNGFQMPMWGDSCSFSGTSGGGGSSSIDDEVAKRGLTRKHNALYKLLEDYAKTLPEGTERDTLEVTLSKYKSVKQENYEELQDLYDEHKTKIQKKFNNGSKIEVSNGSKAAATDFAKTSPDFKMILKVDGENNTTAQLKDGVDAVEFLYSLQATKKKSFQTLYADALKGANDTKKAEMKKVLQAVYNGLTAAANQVKEDNAVSEETKASIGKLLEITDTNATPEHVDQLYYWIRMAKAEIADSKYACLHDDFPDDPLLGKANGVEATTTALKAEGMKVDDIKTQTAVTDFTGNTAEESMKALEGNYVTALTKEQLTTLNGIAGVPKGIKAAWVDNNSRFNYQIIRYIDKDGNLKYVDGVGLKDGKIQTVGGEVKAGNSISPEEIQRQAATLAAVEGATDTLAEIKNRADGARVFEEKIVTGSRKRKRLFVISSGGNLKEWQNMWYVPQKQEFYHNTADATPDVDADLNEIKADVTNKLEANKQAATRALTPEQKQRYITIGGYMRGNLVDYTTEGCWDAFKTNMTNVNDKSVLYILKGYFKNAYEGFFTQVFTENTGRARRAEYTQKMAKHIVAYINQNMSAVGEAYKEEVQEIKKTFETYKFNENAHHDYKSDAINLDNQVKRLFEIFNIKDNY